MKLNKQKKTLAAAIAAATLGLGLAGNAHADAYSYATYDLQNFKINISNPFVVTDAGNRNTYNTASFTGYAPETRNDPVTPPTASDALQAKSGPGAFPGENFFGTWWVDKATPASVGVYQNGQGSRADSLTAAGSGLDQTGNGVPHVQAVAESRIIGGGSGVVITADENAKNTFTAKIKVAAGTTLDFSGAIDFRVIAMTDVAPESAQGFLSSQFRIADAATGANLFTYDPFASSGLQFACASTNGVPHNPNCDIASSFGFRSNAYTVGGTGDQELQINLEMAANGFELSTVPEPASIALLGSGLIGLIGVRRRQRKSQD